MSEIHDKLKMQHLTGEACPTCERMARALQEVVQKVSMQTPPGTKVTVIMRMPGDVGAFMITNDNPEEALKSAHVTVDAIADVIYNFDKKTSSPAAVTFLCRLVLAMNSIAKISSREKPTGDGK